MTPNTLPPPMIGAAIVNNPTRNPLTRRHFAPMKKLFLDVALADDEDKLFGVLIQHQQRMIFRVDGTPSVGQDVFEQVHDFGVRPCIFDDFQDILHGVDEVLERMHLRT